MPPHDLQFNDQVLVDCFFLRDSKGSGHWFMSLLDRATMYRQVTFIKKHTPKIFRSSFFEYWVRWAGTPHDFSVDMERGLVSREFVDALAEAGIKVSPIAGQAHWQHGKIERHGAILKDMMSKVVKKPVQLGRNRWIGWRLSVLMLKTSWSGNTVFRLPSCFLGRNPRVLLNWLKMGNHVLIISMWETLASVPCQTSLPCCPIQPVAESNS